MTHTKTMQVSVNISDEEYRLLIEISEVTGRSNSSLAGEWIKTGIYVEVENLSKVALWRNISTKKSEEKGKSDGKKAYILLAERAKGKALTPDEAEFIIQALPEYDYQKSELLG